MTLLLLLDDEATRRHLARAVAEHLRWCRLNAVVAPAALGDLLEALAGAGSGQQRPGLRGVGEVEDDLAVSYGQAARRLGVSERTVRRMAADGRLPVVAVGRRRLVPVAALTALTTKGAA